MADDISDAIKEYVNDRPPTVEDKVLQMSEEVILEYTEWRAYMQNMQQSATHCSITLEQAMAIEKMPGFFDEIDEIRKKVEQDPEEAIRCLMPRAIGVLRAELAHGNIAAAREVSRLNAIIKTDKKPTQGAQTGELSGNNGRPARSATQREQIAKAAVGISQRKPDP